MAINRWLRKAIIIQRTLAHREGENYKAKGLGTSVNSTVHHAEVLARCGRRRQLAAFTA